MIITTAPEERRPQPAGDEPKEEELKNAQAN